MIERAGPSPRAETVLGAVGIARRTVGSDESRRASRAWWDADADDYQAEHGDDLGDVDFVWCPENLREADAGLLGDPSALVGPRVLAVGCGGASCSRWLTTHGAAAVGLDLAGRMLRQARATAARA